MVGSNLTNRKAETQKIAGSLDVARFFQDEGFVSVRSREKSRTTCLAVMRSECLLIVLDLFVQSEKHNLIRLQQLKKLFKSELRSYGPSREDFEDLESRAISEKDARLRIQRELESLREELQAFTVGESALYYSLSLFTMWRRMLPTKGTK